MAPWKKIVFVAYALLIPLSIWFALQLRFSFSLEDFFPKGDPDLAFYQEFIKEFDSDANFLLIGFERQEPGGVFHLPFLNTMDSLCTSLYSVPGVKDVQSITTWQYPIKTPFGWSAIPALHLDDPEALGTDTQRIMSDNRLVHQLVSEDGKAVVIAMRTDQRMVYSASDSLVRAVRKELAAFPALGKPHLLGPSNFQVEMVRLQQWEVAVSSMVAIILVAGILWWIYRRWITVGIVISTITTGLLVFLGILGLWGRPLNALAALYPVILLIIGTSDMIHISTKYLDELKAGLTQRAAMRVTLKDIGVATLITAISTALGLITLVTSRIQPIADFGLNAAIGTMVCYVVTVTLGTALLSRYRLDQLTQEGNDDNFWHKLMHSTYGFTKKYQTRIALGGLLILAVCIWGTSRITTNYKVSSSLPKGGHPLTEDFHFFEKQFSGFRPLEYAVMVKDGGKANRPAVIQALDTVSSLLQKEPSVRMVTSLASFYRGIHQAMNGGSEKSYVLPSDSSDWAQSQALFRKFGKKAGVGFLLSKDGTQTRISARVLDVGADSIKAITSRINAQLPLLMDTSLVSFRVTGTGVIIDKNSEYVRENLIQGLFISILSIGLLMALMLKDARMMLVAMIPNLYPLMITAALLGFLGIELEAGISFVFSIVFGIAVDDTIHYLAKFRVERNKGRTVEQSIYHTFLETGKATVLTALILFAGFMVMLFSMSPLTTTVGLLIAFTLIGALLCDLWFMPLLLRWVLAKEVKREKTEID